MLTHFYDFENNPHDIPDDVMDKVYEGDKEAIADALCCIAAFTHYNVPAMHRLDMMETVLEKARLALVGKECSCCGDLTVLGAPGAGGAPWICNPCASPV